MSISFKITKVNDSSNKPTVFERLGMKSSKVGDLVKVNKYFFCLVSKYA